MGDLLGYWRRERRVVAADSLRLSMADEHEQLESPRAISRLTLPGAPRPVQRQDRQEADQARGPVHVPTPADRPGHRAGLQADRGASPSTSGRSSTSSPLDPDAGTLTVLANDDLIAGNLPPTCLVHHPTFDERAKLAALSDLADRMLAGDATAVGHALLRRDPTRFLPGHGPADGLFVGDYQHVCAWAPHLDRSYVPVQGPPGTGKTYTGAHADPHPGHPGQARRHHRDEPPRDRQPHPGRGGALR